MLKDTAQPARDIATEDRQTDVEQREPSTNSSPLPGFVRPFEGSVVTTQLTSSRASDLRQPRGLVGADLAEDRDGALRCTIEPSSSPADGIRESPRRC
ncbi:MAG TPA: hypothetical protein VNA28_10665 [Solirubrobacteraceae bacterium]|nr:hypothetical protein [Solirubrobacteraceae bacterium]